MVLPPTQPFVSPRAPPDPAIAVVAVVALWETTVTTGAGGARGKTKGLGGWENPGSIAASFG
ncbi:hypothetical protein Aple_041110 [Acrocarpospora pleiomorpha]|uniref:Uncharacterized protein n=1 Tax=Acrocarpospora pleiomorpha TaxID=90975 RepID=A0A5M3XI91_9ACTN|nr:hypothetical protein Aple_041110 [Acrocarpospora pleiomorpha]